MRSPPHSTVRDLVTQPSVAPPSDGDHQVADSYLGGLVQQVIEHAGMAIAVYDVSGACRFASSGIAHMMGMSPEDSRRTPLWSVTVWKVAGIVHDAVMTLADGDTRTRFFDIPGRERRGQATVHRVRDGSNDMVAVVAIPVSQSLQPPARASMADLVNFASATAHRVTNGLVPANCALDMLASEHADSKVSQMLILQAQDALHRLEQGVSASVSVMADGTSRRRPFAIGDVLSEARRALPPGGLARVFVDMDSLDPQLPRILGNAEQVRQAIGHVIDNALEASPHTPVRVEVEAADLEEPLFLSSGEVLEPGPFVVVSVEDEGPGVDPEAAQRATLPYYSTKGLGRGLGLSTAAKVARDHEGGIDLESEPGQSTVVRIWLAADENDLP